MGTLFPDSDEYPDHEPVPSPLDRITFPRLTLNKAVVTAIVATSIHGMCPLVDAVADPPYEDHGPVSYRVKPPGAIGSTSETPFFGNTSDSTAAQVTRQRRMLNDAQTRAAQMMSSTSAALLFGDTPSSNG